MTTAILIACLLAGLAGVAYVLRGLFDDRLSGMEAKLDRRLGELDSRVDRRLEGIDGRLLSSQRSAGETATQIAEKLGRMEGATTQMLARAAELSRLEQALRPPKARGGFGELLLGNLLRDRLPADAYELQHTFRSGERVDAVIKVDKLVPVDAKFPLDNFERVVEAGEDDEARLLHEKAFARDVMAYVAQLAKDFERFRTDFDVVGKHIGNAQTKYAEADRRLERFETRLERASDWEEHEPIEVAEAHELPRAVDAA